ncbi:MAG: LamG domain-containing protein [Planctomycetota bacterium]|nr:MAG: LamG domain-containing protein [Planctomycetota bacterium]
MFSRAAGKEHVRRATVCFKVGGCVLILAILGGLAGTSAADCNPGGTWNGTWEGNGKSGTITDMVLTCDANVRGRRRIDLRPELPCVPAFEISSTYTFNPSDCGISFQWTDEKPCGDYNVVYAEDVVGVITDCDTAEGMLDGTISVYYDANLVGTGYIQGWWNINRATRPVRATEPSPGHLAKYEPIDVCLSWTNCGGCTFDVYFGTDPTPDISEFQGNQEETFYCPGTLSYSTTYYWRIDARNTRGVTTGYVWRFTTGVQPNPIISGYVRNLVGSGISGVTMEGWPGDDPVTDGSGYYSGAVPLGWSGSITPSKAGYAFSPLNRSYNNVTSDKPNEDYTGATGPISLIEIATGLDYGEPDVADDLRYEFFFGVATGDTVSFVEVYTPGGITFEIPNDANTQSGEIQTWHYADGGIHYWGYEGAFADRNALADYGDGIYGITVYHKDDSNDQTIVWYGIATWQPEQEPVLISPEHNGSTRSPVTFKWEECTDINATSVWLSLANEGRNDWKDISFDVDVTDSGPVVLSEGMWEAELWFEDFYEYNNIDDIFVVEGKYSKSDYAFSVTLSPVGHWKMDDDGPNTAVLDSSGYGNHGTAQQNTSVLHTEGRIDGALTFDGISDYVDCGADVSLALTSWSMSAWIYRSTDSGSYERIISKSNRTGYDYWFQIQPTGVMQAGFVDTGGTPRKVTTTEAISLDKWYHVATTWDGSYIRIYIYGELIATSEDFSSYTARTSDFPFNIGRLGAAGSWHYGFNGIIDNVVIFERALDSGEICDLYEEGRYVGDFVYPDGVDFLDYAFFAGQWSETDYGDVNGVELTGDGRVNWEDFGLFAGWWMVSGCGDCGGADLTGEGNVDYLDLDVFTGYWLESEYGDCGGADLTGDGVVGLDDLARFSASWLEGIW